MQVSQSELNLPATCALKKISNKLARPSSWKCWSLPSDMSPLSSVSILKTCVCPILLYGSVKWILTETVGKKLKSFEMELAKWILRWPESWHGLSIFVIPAEVQGPHWIPRWQKPHGFSMHYQLKICHLWHTWFQQERVSRKSTPNPAHCCIVGLISFFSEKGSKCPVHCYGYSTYQCKRNEVKRNRRCRNRGNSGCISTFVGFTLLNHLWYVRFLHAFVSARYMVPKVHLSSPEPKKQLWFP